MSPLFCRVLRRHRYSDWKLEDATTCLHSTVCKWCGNEKQQIKHVHGPMVRVDPCHSQQACTRCKQVLSEPESHDYGPWEYDRNGACTTHMTCQRCGHRKPEPLRHEWSGWQPDPHGTCEGRDTCTRCGEFQDVRKSHLPYEWHYDPPDSCTGSERCPRCGDTRRSETRHKHDWQYDRPGRCTGSMQCSRCGNTRDAETRHQYDRVAVASDSKTCWRKKCERCGKSTDQPHQYGWAYITKVRASSRESKQNLASVRRHRGSDLKDKCTQVHVCSICDHVHPTSFQPSHDWKRVKDGTTAYFTCRRCASQAPTPGQGNA